MCSHPLKKFAGLIKLNKEIDPFLWRISIQSPCCISQLNYLYKYTYPHYTEEKGGRTEEGRKRTLTHFYNNLLLLINTFVIVVAASQVCHSFNHSFVHFYSPLLFLSPSRNLSDIISIGHFTSHHRHNKFKLKFEWYSKLFGPSYTSCSSLKGLTFSVFLSRSSSLRLSELTTF